MCFTSSLTTRSPVNRSSTDLLQISGGTQGGRVPVFKTGSFVDGSESHRVTGSFFTWDTTDDRPSLSLESVRGVVGPLDVSEGSGWDTTLDRPRSPTSPLVSVQEQKHVVLSSVPLSVTFHVGIQSVSVYKSFFLLRQTPISHCLM